MKDNIKRLFELESQIKYHDYMYHTLDKPVISDAAYDLMLQEYLDLIEETPEYETSFKPGQEIPNPVLGVVEIVEPMISISKRKTIEDFQKWIDVNITGDDKPIYEDKLDGMALRFIYEKGYLVRIHTRGNNGRGTDVSHRRHLLKDVPDHIESIEDLERCEFTGEAFTTFSEFDAWCERHSVNRDEVDTRSSVAGLVKKFKSTERDDLPVLVKIYHASENIRSKVETYLDLRKLLTEYGFQLPKLLSKETVEDWVVLPSKPIEDYPIDGIVVKCNDLSKWNKEQKTGYYTYATCYKFPSLTLTTTVTGIDWSLNNRGYLVGTLMYTPVEYDGTNLSRCKLDYADSYFEKGLRIGSVIQVTKSNEIIPKLMGLVSTGDGEKLDYPTNCPFCDSQLVKEAVGYVKCNNVACEGQLIKRLTRLTERKGLDIQGLADKRIEALVDNGFLAEPGDIFKLSVSDCVLAGFDEATAGKIIDQIFNLNNIPLHRWLYSLAIAGLGITRAIEITNLSDKNGLNDGLKFTDVNSLIRIMKSSEFMVDMFGMDGLMIAHDVINKEAEIYNMLSHYDFSKSHMEGLNGVPIAITGAWNAMTRDQLRESLSDAGYVLAETVTKTACALLTGAKPSPSKTAKAEKWGLPVLDITSLSDIRDVIKLIETHKR